MTRADDLAPLLQLAKSGELAFRQGYVKEFDPATGSSVIHMGGTDVVDLPMLNGTEGYSITAGDVVGLLGWRTSWFIMGRIVVPNDPDRKDTRVVIYSDQGIVIKGGGGMRIEDSGTLETTDQVGEVQTRLGELTTGGYGLEQRVGGAFVPLSSLAGGALIDTTAGVGEILVPNGTASGWQPLSPDGPELTFTTHTGKWMITLSAQVVAAHVAARMSYSTDGAQNVAASEDRSALVSSVDSLGYGTSFTWVHDGAPGTITVKCFYQAESAHPTLDGRGAWRSRSVMVIPY